MPASLGHVPETSWKINSFANEAQKGLTRSFVAAAAAPTLCCCRSPPPFFKCSIAIHLAPDFQLGVNPPNPPKCRFKVTLKIQLMGAADQSTAP
jgi:hypothetical protein